MSSEKYAAVLEAAEETLSEGEYLRVANLLKELNNTSIKDGEVVRVEKTIINSEVNWDPVMALGGNKFAMDIHISEKEHHHIRGPYPDKVFYIGTIDGEPFKMLWAEFCEKIRPMMSAWGVKNISRSCCGKTRLFEDWNQFRQSARDIITTIEDEEDDEPYSFHFLCQILFCTWDGFY